MQSDPVIARTLYISLINGILNDLKVKDRESWAKLRSNLIGIIINVFTNTTAHNKFLISALLQTLFDNDLEIPENILAEGK